MRQNKIIRNWFVGICALIFLGVAYAATHLPGSSTSSAVATSQPTTPSAKSAIRAWAADGGATFADALQADLGKITSTAGDTGATASACLAMQQDVTAAQAFEPVPDATVQASWSSGLAEYYKATGDCVAGASMTEGGGASLIEKAAAEFSSGNALFAKAAQTVNAAS